MQLNDDSQKCLRDIASYKLPNNELNEWLACQLGSKVLVLQHLFTGKEKRFDNVSSYEFDKNNRYLVVQLNNANSELVIYDLVTEKESRFMGVWGYMCDDSSKKWVLKTAEKRDNGTVTSLKVMDLIKYLEGDQAGSIKTIWSTSDSINIISYCIDAAGKQVGFILQELAPEINSAIWLWQGEMDKACLKLDNQNNEIIQRFLFQGPISFAPNTRYLRFSLQSKPDTRQPKPDEVQLTVWSHQDTILQLSQKKLKPASIPAIFDNENGRLIQFKAFENIESIVGNYAIVCESNRQANGDRFWEQDYSLDNYWLQSLEKDNRKFIVKGNHINFRLSPDADYIVFYDIDKQGNYFSYDLRNGKLVNISQGLPAWQFRLSVQQEKTSERIPYAAGIAGWLRNNRANVLIYDNFDVWLLDLTGRKFPVNITNGYGQKHGIQFSLMNSDRGDVNIPILENYDILLFRVFDKEKKYNGFYRKILGTSGNPELLCMGPYFFEDLLKTSPMNLGMNPLKAADTDTWIVMRQTATEAPNYFFTRDFKKFVPLTNYQPQKDYNWLTAELHHFKRLDGSVGKGVLYKPDNFDPAQKYPVIISFYGTLSNQLYQYPSPDYINASYIYSNPAWMVSHGYLVFVPDILFTKNKWGPSTVNTIDGAARYLNGLSYVDGKRLGACGHSNSGRFGYYLLTHSKSFAAISAGSGFCGADVISGALSFPTSIFNNLEVAEVSAFGAALGNLWQNKASWIDHTAVLQVEKVKSPFLLFHATKDPDDVKLAIELFIALRRNEKTAWWLEYDNGKHVLYGKDEKDFTIRFTQFFDHYLKKAPAPKWMTAGLPFKLKGIEARYELDNDGICAKDCQICLQQNGTLLRKQHSVKIMGRRK